MDRWHLALVLWLLAALLLVCALGIRLGTALVTRATAAARSRRR